MPLPVMSIAVYVEQASKDPHATTANERALNTIPAVYSKVSTDLQSTRVLFGRQNGFTAGALPTKHEIAPRLDRN